MNLSLNWLKDFVKLPKNITPEELARKMTLHTVEVEGVIRQEDKYRNVVVGKILEVKKHPNADRLQIALVDIGADKREIVCGAANIAKGQLVPAALPGAILPNGAEIKEAEVRGVKSAGMLCAEDELGLGQDHSGILILKKAKIGQKLADYLGMDDIVLEVDNKSITNRPDLWSHLGMARDIAAIFDLKFSPYLPKPGLLTAKDGEKLKIKVEDSKLCPRYMAVGLQGVKVEPSPKWLQDRLISAGMRPINNIVDITNYVMLELGQPLHAFDRRLADEIIVRRARANEEIVTLDSNKRKLIADDLVIANSRQAVGIAGVMGGENSEISLDTEDILIEAANFDAAAIRKTSTRQGLRSEASMRFEKALDPNLCEVALIRTVELIKQVCPTAEVNSEVADIKNFSLNQGPIEFRFSEIEKIIGVKIEEGRAKKILKNLGFEVSKEGGIIKALIPTWRATKDISIKEDVVEEIARVYGYDQIASSLPLVRLQLPRPDSSRETEKKIKTILALNAGLSEVYNYSFVGEDQLVKLGVDFSTHLRLANPISGNHTLLRQSLAPNLFNSAKVNQARYETIKLFEIGSIYLASPGENIKNDSLDEKLPFQEKRLGLIFAGRQAQILFAEIKGSLELLAKRFGLEISFHQTTIGPAWSEAGYSAEILAGQKSIGYLYKLAGKTGKSIGLKKEVFAAEISLNEFGQAVQQQGATLFREFEKFPPVIRDLAFVIDGKIVYNDIKQAILAHSPIIAQAELFDVYEDDKLGAGKKSLAFRIIYQADRTMTSAEVDEVQTGLIQKLETSFNAKVRDF